MTIFFYCGVDLKARQAEDDLWAEHAFWSPFCDYVSYIRGKRFVEYCIIMRDF